MPTYTLPELLEAMEPQSKSDKALIADCIAGLGLYAAGHAGLNPDSSKIAEMRSLVETLVCYWGLDDVNDDPMLSQDILNRAFLQPFDDRIEDAVHGAETAAITTEHAAITVYGLYRYGMEMTVAQGVEAKDDILSMGALMKEIAAAWDYESDTLDGLVASLEAEAQLLADEPAPDHDMQVGGMG
jgi:hypothetical protein